MPPPRRPRLSRRQGGSFTRSTATFHQRHTRLLPLTTANSPSHLACHLGHGRRCRSRHRCGQSARGSKSSCLAPSQPASQPSTAHLHHWHSAGCHNGKWDGLAGHVRERTTSLRAQTSTAWSEQSPLPVLRPARRAGDRRAAHHVAQCMSGRVARRGGTVLQSRGLDGSALHLHGQRVARARGRAHDVGRLGSGRRDVRRGLQVDSCATSGREKAVAAAQVITGGRASLRCSRVSGITHLEVRERRRSSVYMGTGSLRCQPAGDQAGLLHVTNIQPAQLFTRTHDTVSSWSGPAVNGGCNQYL